MSDAATPVHLLGIGDPPEQPSAPPSAADAAATAPATPEGESPFISVDEALAALERQDAPPQTEAAAAAEESPGDPTPLTPEQIAALLAENEAFKAEKAEREAARAEEDYTAQWEDFIANGEAFYEACAEIVSEWGASQGMNPREIKGLIAEVVDEGRGIEHVNKIAAGRLVVPQGQPGFLAWQRTVQENWRADLQQRLTQQAAPSAIDALATKYGLDEADRTALRKFANYPTEAVEEIARTLGAKNARVSGTLSSITQQANRNVAASLANQVAPGSPGAPAPKQVVIDHTRRSTEYVARAMGWLRDSA